MLAPPRESPWPYGVAALVGALSAGVLLGSDAVNPRRTDWLLHGDAATHLLGWLFLRNAPPAEAARGVAGDYLFPVGVSVALTDSIPLVALPLRALSPLLGRPFQYFGLWLVLAFALQGAAGVRLLGAAGVSPPWRALGAVLFVLFPPLAWRLAAPDLGHASLCMHAPLLLGLAWALEEGPPPPLRHARWCALTLATAAVHVYLAAMVTLLYAADSGRRAWSARAGAAFVELAPVALSVGATAAVLAWLGVLVGARGGPGGYGFYVASLDALVESRGFSAWVPALRVEAAQTEGYGYLGLGASLVVLAALAARAFDPRTPSAPSRWRFVALVSCAFALFALSSSVRLGSAVVLDAGALSRPFEPALRALRATGRFVWVPLYALLAWAVREVASRGRGRALLALCAAAQAAEMLPAFARWEPPAPRAWRASHPAWRASAGRYRHLSVLPARFVNTACRSPAMPWPSFVGFGLLAAENRWTFNGGYSGRPPREAIERYCAAALASARRGERRDDTVYVFATGALYEEFQRAAGASVRCGELDGARTCVAAARPSPLRDALSGGR